MKMICLWLYLFNAGASLPVNPVGNIFKARAKTPIIAQAITDFQDICLTFALHESEVSIQDDMKHFTSMINHAGYEKRDLTQTEQAASIMSLQHLSRLIEKITTMQT